MKKIKILTIIVIATVVFASETEAQKQPPPPPPIPEKIHADNDVRAKMNDYLRNYPSVNNIFWENKNMMVVKLKNGKVEKYNMANDEQNKTFVDKYGDVPSFLPPPPPPPPLPSKE